MDCHEVSDFIRKLGENGTRSATRAHQPKARALALRRSKSEIRTREFSDTGIPRNYLQRLINDGIIVLVGCGLDEVSNRALSVGGTRCVQSG